MTNDSNQKFELETPAKTEPRTTLPPPGNPPYAHSPAPDIPFYDQPLARRLWFWIPLFLFVGGAVSVITTQDSIGYAWDEAYYYEPARDAALWVRDLPKVGMHIDSGASFREWIDLYWEERHEHPSIQKLISGFSLIALEETFGRLLAMRLPIAILFGSSLVLIYLLGRRAWSATAGLFAALAYWGMPRIFGHAHFASMETPLVFSTLLAVYAFVRGLDHRGWSILAGVSLGLLLATKINGFFLLPPLILWGYLYARREVIHNLFWMAIVGPIVFVLLWPWLWPSPITRLLDYFTFHAQHQQTAVYFLGTQYGYGGPQAPWYYPSVIIGVTVPVLILGFCVLGILRSLVRIQMNRLGALYLLLALTNWIVASAPSTPKYDGERLFLPVFPFLALLAGSGGELLPLALAWIAGRSQRRTWEERFYRARKGFRVAAWLVGMGILIDGTVGIILSYPYLLSYFNPAVGGIAGAEKMGFEVTYWGEAVNSDVLRQLNQLPPKSNIKLLALHEKCFDHLKQWGMVRRDLEFEGSPPYYAHLMLFRRGFFARPEKALADTGIFRPIQEWKEQGVRLVGLYRTGQTFEDYWRQKAPGGKVVLPVILDNESKTTETVLREQKIPNGAPEPNAKLPP